MSKAVNNAAEALGYGLILGFLYVVWAPLVLLGGGLLLVVWANTRDARGGARQGRTAAVLGAAWGAARAAYRRQQDVTDPPPVRRIA